MNEITDQELLRRLKLIRKIRLGYVKKYNLSKEDIYFNYDLLPNLNEAEYCIVEKDSFTKIIWGKFVHSKTITNYDPSLDAKYNGGEQQGYWGDDTIVHGNFQKELGYIYDSDLINKDFSDECIYQKEKKKIKDLIEYLVYALNGDAEYNQKKIDEAILENEKLKKKLEKLKKIEL